jgi:hypothetical protein
MDIDRRRIGSFNAWATQGILDAIEAFRMNLSNGEKGMFAVIGLCVFSWFFGSSPKLDPTQCDIPSSDLIEQVNSVMSQPSKTPEIDDVHETDFGNISSPSDKPSKIEILVFVSKNCPPCEKWKRCEMQNFLDAGWQVGIIEDHPFPVTPRYEVSKGSDRKDHVGYLTFEQAKGLVK